MRRRDPNSYPAVDTCLLCWAFQEMHDHPIRRAHGIYIERPIPGRYYLAPIERPMSLCQRCADEHAEAGERLGYTVHWVPPIPPRLTPADVERRYRPPAKRSGPADRAERCGPTPAPPTGG